MLNKSAFSTSLTAWAVVPSLLFLCAGAARAQTSAPAHYSFVVASGFLCDPGDSGTCPAVAKSVNGDTYEISGAGTFDPRNKSVKGAGTFTHKSTNGSVLETGVWTASALTSFDSYGIASPAVLQRELAVGGPQIGYRRLPMRPGPLPTGGLAIFHILLSPLSGITQTAVLQVNCALGNVPGERSVEGIRIRLERNNFEYSEEASGRVIFLALRPEVSAPAKMRIQEARPETPEQPQK
jgi:hypothetical protein